MKHFAGQQPEILSEHEFELLPSRHFPPCRFGDLLDKGKIQQWLTALELDFDCRRGGCESDAKGTYRRVFAHVETFAIHAAAGYLTIGARVFAAQGNDKNMQGCGLLKESHPTAEPHREQLKL